MSAIHTLSVVEVLCPLLGSIIAGLFGKKIGRAGAHWVTISLMAVALCCAVGVFVHVVGYNHAASNWVLYHWVTSGRFQFDVGFLIDHLAATMMLIVCFVSFLVHIYSVGYMVDDPGYQRFFSYVSLFTFMMLMLIAANNFFQLFFGWEGVGLVSYLLIGFWFGKESAAVGSLKAFIANRVGDFGFILGIAAILDTFGSINYAPVFSHAHTFANTMITIFPHTEWHLMTVICVCLFIGAMGKSAQMPLHIWLPESMEGPTPISALIHAATMVTAGVYMVARMSPLFELSTPALSMVLVIGATGALFTGLLAFVEFDIKRVIAYSTMSQLGYMMAANGVSAFGAGIFHLLTHACFKALLFLSAGSVIIAMHHDQDLRNMGGLRKYMPITYACFLVGALALAAIPPFSGFYSKDAIIQAVGLSSMPGATYAYWCLLLGAFVTGYYIFRAFFMAFHGQERMGDQLRSHLKESHWTVTVPMIMLAIPATFLGMFLVYPALYGKPGLFGNSFLVLPHHDVLALMAKHYRSAWADCLHAFADPAFYFALGGVFMAYFNVMIAPGFTPWLGRKFKLLHTIMVKQYGFDWFNDFILVRGTRQLSEFFYKTGDLKILDHYMVDGSGRSINRISQLVRRMQTGYLYHYVLVMLLGLLAFLLWLIVWK